MRHDRTVIVVLVVVVGALAVAAGLASARVWLPYLGICQWVEIQDDYQLVARPSAGAGAPTPGTEQSGEQPRLKLTQVSYHTYCNDQEYQAAKVMGLVENTSTTPVRLDKLQMILRNQGSDDKISDSTPLFAAYLEPGQRMPFWGLVAYQRSAMSSWDTLEFELYADPVSAAEMAAAQAAAAPSRQVQVISSTGTVIHSLYEVAVQVQNTSDREAVAPIFIVSAYDAHDHLIGVEIEPWWHVSMPAGQLEDFEVLFADLDRKVDHYLIQVKP